MAEQISKTQRFKLEKYGDKCFYCGIVLTHSTLTVDHVIPASKGGTKIFENLLPACQLCNYWKSDRDFEDFREEFYASYVKFAGETEPFEFVPLSFAKMQQLTKKRTRANAKSYRLKLNGAFSIENLKMLEETEASILCYANGVFNQKIHKIRIASIFGITIEEVYDVLEKAYSKLIQIHYSKPKEKRQNPLTMRSNLL